MELTELKKVIACVEAREEATDALRRKDAELQEASAWAKEVGQEAAELRAQIRHMQTKLTEHQQLVREAR